MSVEELVLVLTSLKYM